MPNIIPIEKDARTIRSMIAVFTNRDFFVAGFLVLFPVFFVFDVLTTYIVSM